MASQEVLTIENPHAIERALEVLKAGKLVAFPTDTVYGLAANVLNFDAVARLYEAKGRDNTKAIAVLVGEVNQLPTVAQDLPESANRLAAHFWPGALTLVVPKNEHLPENLSVYPTVGVRMPDYPFTIGLLQKSGPLATTSANQSGGPNPITAQDVIDQLGDQVALVLDGGPCPGGVPSTVVDCTGSDVRILRQGAISKEMIESLFG